MSQSENKGAPSLQLFANGEIVFESAGTWLHPLFDLESFLDANPVDLSDARIRDKIVGKAAALLIARLGIKQVHGDTMSLLASRLFDNLGTSYTFDAMVDRIDCRTEEILLDIDDPDRAHRILRQRAGR